MTNLERGVIVTAYGARYYIEMAKTLARSLRLHSPLIPRAIVTDNLDDKELRELFDYIVPLKKDTVQTWYKNFIFISILHFNVLFILIVIVLQ